MGEQEAVHLLETTLRDGSYEVDFQFTAEDTAIIASGLEQAGFRYIEVGHGMGVGGHLRPPEIVAKLPKGAVTDRAYMNATGKVITCASWGVIACLGPGEITLEYLDELARHGMSFVRFAIWPNEERSRIFPFVERAKAHGLKVSINVMQSYVLSAAKLAALAADAAKVGLDWFYIVDSAGGMQPEEVATYVRASREASGLQIGLHGHNNLGLALANSLAAIAAGATMVDCTLNGIGRATGNAPTEQLLLAVQNLGHETNINNEAVGRLGYLARDLYAARGQDPIHFASGAAKLHSRNVTSLLQAADARGRARAEFLLRAADEARRHDCISDSVFPPSVLDYAAEHSSPTRLPRPTKELVAQVSAELEDRTNGDLAKVCAELKSRSRKHRKKSVLHLAPRSEHAFDSALPWETEHVTGVTVPVGSTQLAIVPELALPDVLLLDTALEHRKDLPLAKETRISCTQRALLVHASVDLIAALRATKNRNVWLAPQASDLRAPLESQLELMAIPFSAGELPPGSRVLVFFDESANGIEGIDSSDVVVLLGIRKSRSIVDQIRAKGATAFRPHVGLAAAARTASVLTLIGAARASQPTKKETIAWVGPLVAPASGELVVDDRELPAVIVDRDERPLDQVLATVAEFRAETLLSGKGSL